MLDLLDLFVGQMRLEDKSSKIKNPKGIDYKIVLAYHLQANFGQALLQDKEIRSRLLQLDQNIESTWKEMVSIGVVRECSDCAAKEGSCCGTGMENSYDGVLLLINLLLGRALPSQAYDTNCCYFLGEDGCLLRAREVICVNYLCGRIWRNIEKEKLIHLQRVAGQELKTLFMLEEGIKKRLKGKGLLCPENVILACPESFQRKIPDKRE